MTRVLVVDDQRTIRHFLETIINDSKRYELVASIESAFMAEMYCVNHQVDLILMDVYTAHRESGLTAAQQIKAKYPRIKIIIITSIPEYSFIQKAKAIGCESFWYKDTSDISLLEVMDRTMANESVYPENTPTLQIGSALSDEFTKRELEVLHHLVAGLTQQEISERLFISHSTVKYHINSILSKSGYHNTVRLLIDIAEQKFIIPDF